MTKPTNHHAHFWSQQYLQYGGIRRTRVWVNRGNGRQLVLEGLPLVTGPAAARALQAAYESGIAYQAAQAQDLTPVEALDAYDSAVVRQVTS